MIKSDNTIEIIEKNIYSFYGGQLPMNCCNEIANNILNDFEANGFEIVRLRPEERS